MSNAKNPGFHMGTPRTGMEEKGEKVFLQIACGIFSQFLAICPEKEPYLKHPNVLYILSSLI